VKVNLRDLSEVFGQQRIYVVPPFQRQYVWKRDEQWEPLWEDIKKSAAQCLDAQRRTTGQPEQSHPADHFLGAIVIQEADPQARVQVRNLIDGQQRLVTMQLVLRSVESAFAEHAPAASRRVGHLVQNSEDYVDDDPDLKFKVHPTEFDGVTFRNTMLAPTSSSRKNDKPPIVQARDFFSTAIHQ